MKQYNQIGKYTKKEVVLNAKKGRTFVTPMGKEYQFDYERVSKNSYHFIILYKDKRWRMKESEFNRSDIDSLLISIENHIKKWN